MEELLKMFEASGPWVGIILGGYAALNVVGEVCEKMGKIVPEFMKIRKFFTRRHKEKKAQKELLATVTTLLTHYSDDNIAHRDNWMKKVNENMQWVHDRADIYDESIVSIQTALKEATNQLRANTEMTTDMFVESSRDRIIDFAEKASNENRIISHEQFSRIFRVYTDYENFLKTHNRTNGEVDTAYQLIQEAYKYRLKHQCFAEDLKGLPIRIKKDNEGDNN